MQASSTQLLGPLRLGDAAPALKLAPDSGGPFDLAKPGQPVVILITRAYCITQCETLVKELRAAGATARLILLSARFDARGEKGVSAQSDVDGSLARALGVERNGTEHAVLVVSADGRIAFPPREMTEDVSTAYQVLDALSSPTLPDRLVPNATDAWVNKLAALRAKHTAGFLRVGSLAIREFALSDSIIDAGEAELLMELGATDAVLRVSVNR